MCGADLHTAKSSAARRGSSPRVRSRRNLRGGSRGCGRIISACAEQTTMKTRTAPPRRDHLRVCGADKALRSTAGRMQGSSPRVRSRHLGFYKVHLDAGIISACAEQTLSMKFLQSYYGDHLRVCGADRGPMTSCGRRSGSSPRVRSRPPARIVPGGRSGIISACAEQTRWIGKARIIPRDHLRVCGADFVPADSPLVVRGSSPRVRSRRDDMPAELGGLGIISACAEQTERYPCRCSREWDHLRVCGADTASERNVAVPSGSSPRVRSRPVGCRRA